MNLTLGTYLLDKVTGALKVVANIFQGRAVVEPAAGQGDPEVIHLAELEDRYVHGFLTCNAAGPNNPGKQQDFNEMELDNLRSITGMGAPEMERIWWEWKGRLDDINSEWIKLFRKVLTKDDMVKLRHQLRPYNKALNKARSALDKQLRALHPRQRALILNAMERQKIIEYAKLFCLSVNGEGPSKEFMAGLKFQLDKTYPIVYEEIGETGEVKVPTAPAMEGALEAQEAIRRLQAGQKYHKALGDIRQFQKYRVPEIAMTLRKLQTAADMMEDVQIVFSIAGASDIIKDPNLSAEDKLSGVLNEIISEFFDKVIQPGVPLPKEVAEKLPSASGQELVDLFLSISDMSGPEAAKFRDEHFHVLHIINSLNKPMPNFTGPDKSAVSSEQRVMLHIGSVMSSVLEPIGPWAGDVTSQLKFEQLVSQLAPNAEAYFTPISDMLRAAQDTTDEGIDEYTKYTNSVIEDILRKSGKVSTPSIRVLSSRGVTDMIKSVWMTTDFINGLYDLLESKLNVTRTAMGFAYSAKLQELGEKVGRKQSTAKRIGRKQIKRKPASALEQAATEGLFEFGTIPMLPEKYMADFAAIDITDLESRPTGFVPASCIAWGAFKGSGSGPLSPKYKRRKTKPPDVESFSYLKPGPGPKVTLFTLRVGSLELEKVVQFDDMDLALKGLAARVDKIHRMPIIYDGKHEGLGDADPSVATTARWMKANVELVDAFKDILISDDPRAKTLRDQIHRVLGVGHPHMLDRLSARFANASTLPELIKAVVSIAERMREGTTRMTSVSVGISRSEADYRDRSTYRVGTSPEQREKLDKITTGPAVKDPLSRHKWEMGPRSKEDIEDRTFGHNPLVHVADQFHRWYDTIEQTLSHPQADSNGGYAAVESLIAGIDAEVDRIKSSVFPTSASQDPDRKYIFPRALIDMNDPIQQLEDGISFGPLKESQRSVLEAQSLFGLSEETQEKLYKSK